MAATPSDRVPQEVISKLLKDAVTDPKLPRSNPTEAFWQTPPSEISNHRSETIAERTTYAIIGSGITACSVAKNLLDNLPASSNVNVTVLEARSLCSGATGRNGGHLLSPIPDEFTRMEKHFGTEETTKIGRFANRTLASMYDLASSADEALRNAAEVRKVKSVCGYWDAEIFEATKQSMKRYEECLPEEKGDYEAFGPEEALSRFNIKTHVGVITNSAGAFWPYRLVTGIWSRLLEQYPSRLNIETNTPVTSVKHHRTQYSDTDFPYTLMTSRGQIRATKVIYCTNGWSGHLLPGLRGKIFPLRGTMSTQAAGPDFPREGDKKSWSTVDRPTYDASDNTFSYGLYYITQNAHTGDIFIGGEKQLATEILSSDDSTISATAEEKLVNVLPTIFDKGWPNGQKPEVKQVWSGVMGFTPDHLPWVGQIPRNVTGRRGDGEYIAAGYNGYGMPLCWGCGEAVAKMILGMEKEVEQWLPSSFLISQKRLASPYSTPEAAIAGLLEQPLSWAATLKLLWYGLASVVHQNLLARLG